MLALLLPALLMLPQLFVAQHNPLAFSQQEALDHHQLTPVEAAGTITNNQHTHDDGDHDEQRSNHLHGHNPADHSHENAYPLLQVAVSLPSPRYSPIHVPYTSVSFRQSPPIRPPKIAFYA